MKEITVLLTACIEPPKRPGLVLVRTDPEERLNDYLTALVFWLQLRDDRVRNIVFSENSGYSLDRLKAVAAEQNPHGRKVEFLQSTSNWWPEGVHYGWAELEIIDRSLQQSRFLAEASYFAKVTGRLCFPQFTRLLDKLPAEFLFAVDARNNRWFVKTPQVFVTTQCMLFKTSFYREFLLGVRSEMGGGVTHIEDLLYRKLVIFRDREGAVLRWPCNCDPVGIGAHWNKDYRSKKQRAISACRALARRLAPRWWV